MPIYAYRCESCGHSTDVLQKISDPILTDCAACGRATLRKQLTAAGFQLKGSGWYVTDFRGGGGAAPAADKASAPADAKPAATGDGAGTSSSAASPAVGCGAACACA